VYITYLGTRLLQFLKKYIKDIGRSTKQARWDVDVRSQVIHTKNKKMVVCSSLLRYRKLTQRTFQHCPRVLWDRLEKKCVAQQLNEQNGATPSTFCLKSVTIEAMTVAPVLLFSFTHISSITSLPWTIKILAALGLTVLHLKKKFIDCWEQICWSVI
jgi:hypothetical protein